MGNVLGGDKGTDCIWRGVAFAGLKIPSPLPRPNYFLASAFLFYLLLISYMYRVN
jgi:hypothetical protein